MIFCDLCQTSYSSHHAWETHLKGKKHKGFASAQQKRVERAERSIFVTGFRAGIHEGILGQYFEQFGHIENIIVDKQNGVFAIIEFSNIESAKATLGRNHMLGGRALKVKPRRVKEDYKNKRGHHGSNSPPSSKLTYESIIDLLLTAPDVARQMVLLMDVLKLSEEEIEERKTICTYFDKLFEEYFSYSEVHLFGSSVNGLGVHGCDVDLLLTLKREQDDTRPTTYPEETNPDSFKYFQDIVREQERKLSGDEFTNLTPIDVVSLLKMIIKKRGAKCSHVITIPSKRCPIVQFTIKNKSNLMCDLSVKNRLSVYNSKLIHLFMNSDCRILPLTFAVRYWAKRREISAEKSNRISSYATTMLVIFFLQVIEPPVLPTVQQLRDLGCESRVQGGWECSFCDDKNKFPVTENTDSIVDLYKAFFEYYNQYNFSTDVICPFDGISVSKENVKASYPDFQIKHICVQDPFDFSHNVTANMNEGLTAKFLEALSDASAICGHEYIWHQSRIGAPWGLIALFDNVGPQVQRTERTPFSDEEVNSHENNVITVDSTESAGISTKDDVKRKRDDLSEGEISDGPQLRFSILNPSDVQQIRNCVPSTSKTSSFDSEWFRSICQSVYDVFSVALQFSCSIYQNEMPLKSESASSTSTGLSRKRSSDSTLPSGKKFKPSTEGIAGEQSSEEDWHDALEVQDLKSIRLDKVLCKVYHRTWVGRKKAKSAASSNVLSLVESEGMISKFIITKSNRQPTDPLFSFFYKVELTSLPEVFVSLTALTDCSELNGCVFSFLQSYVPKTVKQMKDAKQIV